MFRVLLTLLLVAVLAPAQPAEEQTITVDVDLVNIYFTVCNTKGRPVGDLGRESFSVFEDGERQIITNFSRETDAPLTFVLLIDTSGSVRDKLRLEQKAAVDFLFTILRPSRDKAALFSFDHFFELQQDYTDDAALLAAAIQRLRAGGGTRLYDALYFVLQGSLTGKEERKAIVLITDGDDTSSRRSPQEVVELAQRNNVSIYAISMNGLGIPGNRSVHSDQILEILASQTGGKAFFPVKVEKLGPAFGKIGNDLRSQYAIAYRPTNLKRDGTFRRIRIDVKKSQYSVRARSGYYAPLQITAERN